MEHEAASLEARYSYLLSEIDSAYHAASLKCGVSDSVMWILYAICLFGDRCPLSEIITLSGISKQTINSALRKLEQEGSVYLETDGRRRKTVCLTEKGKQLAKGSAMRVMAIENKIFRSWTPEEQKQFFELMARFLADFQSHLKELDGGAPSP